MLLAQQAGQLRAGRNPLTHLRTRYWHDQLGYLSIAANANNGDLGLTEPVTLTGVNHYPRFYYTTVGAVARLFNLEIVTAWNLLSFTLQFLAVLSIGLVAVSLSRRWWAGFFAPLPFFTGTFAYLVTPGSWFTALESHAVLWGPWGVLFSNNGETAGLCVGIIAICATVWAWAHPRRTWVRATITIIAAASIGMLSSFQTYSFLTLTYTFAAIAAAAALILARKRAVLSAVTLLAVVVVFAVGPVLAERVGQLPTLVFGLLPFIPGIVLAIVQSKGLVAAAGAAAGVTAAPQLIWTVSGILQGDDFLTYRVASNHDLGVVSWQALVGAAVVLVALVGFGLIGFLVRDALTMSLTTGSIAAFVLLALNDVWGANAEPYRFWIDGFLVGGVLALLSGARLTGVLFVSSRRTAVSGRTRPSGPALALVSVWALVGVLWVAALPDWVNSLRDDYMQSAWDPQSSREIAIGSLAREATQSVHEGLLTTDGCIDNRTTKLLSGAPIANYHLGMAWPSNRAEIDSIMLARDAGALDPAAMLATDTRWVLTDSNCEPDWAAEYADILTPVATRDYTSSPTATGTADSSRNGTITLWRLNP